LKRYLIYILLLIIPVTVFAQKVYKWTDGNGKTHYGDKPGPDVNSEKLLIKTNKPSKKPIQSENETLSVEGEAATDTTAPDVMAQPNIQQCINLVKGIAKEKLLPTSQRRKNHAPSKAKVRSLCPNTSYKCIVYKLTPTMNSCTANSIDNGLAITVNTKSRWSASDKSEGVTISKEIWD